MTDMLDPHAILFSIPTLANDLPPLTALERMPGDEELVFHEDEWCQIEFFPQSRLNEIRAMLVELSAFEREHRVESGWRQIYVRVLLNKPVLAGAAPLHQLEELLDVQAVSGLVLHASRSYTGRVDNGFSLPLGGDVSLYGYVAGRTIPSLGALVGENPDNQRLAQAFATLNEEAGLILVDWRAQMLLQAVDSSGRIEVWQPDR